MKKRLFATLTIAACTMLAVPHISAQGADPQKTPLSAEEASFEMEDYISKAKSLVALLESITDKATADAAAPEVAVLRKEIRWIVAYVRNHDSEAELLELLADSYPEAIELENQLLQLDLKMAKQKWFGSDALRSCYEEGKADDSDVIVAKGKAPVAKPAPKVEEAPAPAQEDGLTAEQKQFYSALLHELHDLALEADAILAGVTDKASADAAAPKMKDMAAKIVALENRAIQRGQELNSPAVEAFIDKETAGWQDLLIKLNEHGARLRDADYYGSTDLKDAMH